MQKYKCGTFFLLNYFVKLTSHTIKHFFCEYSLYLSITECSSNYPTTSSSILSIIDSRYLFFYGSRTDAIFIVKNKDLTPQLFLKTGQQLPHGLRYPLFPRTNEEVEMVVEQRPGMDT